MTFWETIQRGEYVMIALGVVCIIIICILWARSASLMRQKKSYGPLMHRLRDYIVEGDIENARQACLSSGNNGSKVIYAGLNRIGHPMWDVRAAMSEVAQVEKTKMWKGSLWLRALAVISPLLGLGGTLVGIIDRLRDLGISELPVEISTVCNAIAPTIVTTVAGLGVGILSLIALACLESVITSARSALEELEIEFTDLLNEPV